MTYLELCAFLVIALRQGREIIRMIGRGAFELKHVAEHQFGKADSSGTNIGVAHFMTSSSAKAPSQRSLSRGEKHSI